eukprot:668005-Pleurochrysis_carterae.AAC.1
MCHVHPLPTTNVTPFRPVPRAWRLSFRRSRPTNSAGALAAGPRATARARKGEGSGEASGATLALLMFESDPCTMVADDIFYPPVARDEGAQRCDGEARCESQCVHRSASDVEPQDIEGDARGQRCRRAAVREMQNVSAESQVGVARGEQESEERRTAQASLHEQDRSGARRGIEGRGERRGVAVEVAFSAHLRARTCIGSVSQSCSSGTKRMQEEH